MTDERSSVVSAQRSPAPLGSAGPAAAAGPALLAGRWRLGARLAAGASRVTYRATDARSGREVALRVITPPPGRADEVLARLRRGAGAAAAVQHVGVVTPSVVERDGDVVLWATPFLDGGSVNELLDAGEPLPFDAVLALLSDAAAALAQAHARGVVHGGLKPTNLFADADGRARITDFGIHDVERAFSLGGGGPALSAYAAPEQWRGQLAEPPTDQYALAVIAYELITGQRRPTSVVEGIATLEPLEVQAHAPLQPGLGMHVNEALKTALSASSVNRYASVTAFVQALAGPGHRGAFSRNGRGWPALRARHLAALGVAGAAAALLTLALDPGVRRTVSERWRTLGRRATRSAASLEARTTQVSAGALGRNVLRGGTLAVGGVTRSGATSSGAPSRAPASDPARGAGAGNASRAPRQADAGAGSRSVGGGAGSVGGGTNSEVVQPGSGGSRRGSGEGTAAGTAVTVGSRTQSAVSESRGVVGRIMDRLVPSRVAAGTGSPSSPSAVAPAPSGASVRVVPGATTAASSNGAAAAQGFVSVTATNSLPVVLVDGVPRGVAPAIVRVAGGSHRVEVRAPGMRFRPATITVGVTAGDTAVVAFWRIP